MGRGHRVCNDFTRYNLTIMELKIYLGFVALLYNIIWIVVAKKHNGNFDKKETVQLLLGNLTVVIVYAEFTEHAIDWLKWLIVLGSLLFSVGLGEWLKQILSKK